MFVVWFASSVAILGCAAQPTHDGREDPSTFTASTDRSTNGAGSSFAKQLVGDYRSGDLYPRFSIRADGTYAWDDSSSSSGEVGTLSLWNDGHGRNYVKLLASHGTGGSGGTVARWFRIDGVAPTLLVGIAGTLGNFHGITPPGGCTSSLECGAGEQCISGGSCVASPLCVQLTTPDGVVRARNFPAGSYGAASTWASSTAAGGSYVIGLGTCSYLVSTTACSDVTVTTCALISGADDAVTYDSACAVMRAVMDAAGTDDAIGITHAGACAPDVTSCATYYRSSGGGAFTYFAHTFGSTFEANAWLQLSPGVSSPLVVGDDCAHVPACPDDDLPVCGGVKFGAAGTFRNQCYFEAAVLHDTAATGWSKGYWQADACR